MKNQTPKQKLEDYIGSILVTRAQEKCGGASFVADAIWKLFDIENRDSLKRDIQRPAVEPEKKVKPVEK